MNLLLDTHAFLWFVGGSDALSADARAAIEDPDNSSFLSMASAWELSIKSSLGKIEFVEPFESFLPEQLTINGFDLFNIDWRHVAQVHSLPYHHRDPFDRLLVAQALVENMPVVSKETGFDAYGVTRIW
jgi:PIN domain nuclease of toxin-antitoxin system